MARADCEWVATVELLRDVADERRPRQTQALEDRRRLQDSLAAGRSVAPQSARGCAGGTE
jgi:hypothetical protein